MDKQQTESTTQVFAQFNCDSFKLHPHYIFRVAGQPAKLMGLSETGNTAKLIQQRIATEISIAERVDAACAIIEKKIPGLADKKLSNNLLNLKRSIFNSKKIRAGHLDDVAVVLSDEEYQQLAKIIADIHQVLEMKAQLLSVYEQELADTQPKLFEMWDDRNFQHGLSYSNPKLFSDLASLYHNPDKKIKAKKRRQLEAGLVRYSSRCAVKTSPLSTFTPSIVGPWRDSDGSCDLYINITNTMTNKMEFKAGLVQCIIDVLAKNYHIVKHILPLQLNPSMKIINNEIISFKKLSAGGSVNGRVWGTGEANAQFKMNKMIYCVICAFKRLPKTSLTLQELTESVLSLAPKLEAKFIDDLVNKLFDMELIQADTGYRAQMDILDWASHVFANVVGEIGDGLRGCIAEIRAQLAIFGTATPVERMNMVRTIGESVGRLANLIGAQPDGAMFSPAFFENSYIGDGDINLSKDFLKPFIDDFSLLTEMSPLYDVHQIAQLNFADFFIDKFGEDGVCENPTQLIEEFVQVYGVGQPHFVPDKSKYSPRSDVFVQFNDVLLEFTDYLIKQMQTSDVEVKLQHQDLKAILQKLPQAVINRGASHSYLGQIGQAEGNAKFVINQVFSGQSGLLSRFLEGLDEQNIAQVKDYLQQITRDGKYTEIGGVFGFNANRHPQMADSELEITPFATSWQDSEKLKFDELPMVFDKATHRVYLRSAEGQLIDMWYHGFLMPLLLPSMQRALAMLGMNGVLVYVLPIVRSGLFSSNDEIKIIPRLSLGNTVLIRRSHLIPRKFLPSLDLSPECFFEALQQFRDEHDLPNEVFVRVSPFDANPDAMPEGQETMDWANVDFKNMKPFYLKIDNVRSVQLFYAALSRNNFPAVFTEALPHVRDQHFKVDGNDHVAEIQFELTKKPLA